MRSFITAIALIALAVLVRPRPEADAPPASAEALVHSTAAAVDLAALPLSFEANRGQHPSGVDFVARGAEHAVFLTPAETVLVLPEAAPLRMRLVGARAAPGEGLERLAGTVNVFKGDDPARWRTGIPTFARVRYAGVYPGVDAVYYGRGRKLEFDLVVAPGADPAGVRLAWEGAEAVALDGGGDLLLHTVDGIVRQRAPVAYQERCGEREAVASRYVLDGDLVCLDVGAYDRSRTLVIDPVVDYATYLGGSAVDSGQDVDVDAQGNIYVTGSTQSADFPLQNPYQGTYSGSYGDVFVSKISADGQTLVYSTYVGGSVGDVGYGIAVDGGGHAYVTGATGGSISFNDFPVVNAIQPGYGGTDDAILFKLSPDGGQLLFSTYLGGGDTDLMSETELAPDGTIVIAGAGGNGWPTTPGAYDRNAPFAATKGAVARVAPDGSALIASTFLAVSSILDLAVDGGGRPYLTGRSGGFPTTPGSFQPTQAGDGDAYMAVLSADLTALDAGTHLGGSDGDRGTAIAVDGAGDAYLTGRTESNDAAIVPFPITAGVFQPSAPAGSVPGFVAKLSADATTLLYSSFLGGSVRTEPFDVTVDTVGRAYVTGETSSSDFPLVAPTQQCSTSDGDDAFVSRVAADASALEFSTCLAAYGTVEALAIRLDRRGNAIVTGRVFSNLFPVEDPLQGTYGGSGDAFVARYRFDTFEPYCTCAASAPCGNADPGAGCANATGSGGLLSASGSASVAADDLFLTASGLPANKNGLLFMGSARVGPLPLGDGLLCVGGGLRRFPVQSSGPQGSFTRGPIVGHTHANFPPAAQIAPGQTWNFQVWHRDPQGPCGQGSNLTSALSVTFGP